MFSKETYQKRREKLQAKVKSGVLLFLGNEESPMNFADNTFPFRQDSSFLYYFGIQEPKLAAVMDIDQDKTIIFADELSIDAIVWMGSQETIKSKAEKAGVTETRPFQDLFTYIQNAKGKGRNIHHLPPYQPSNKILLSRLLDTSISTFSPSVSFIKAVASQRSIKEDQEVKEIENAANISNEIHRLAMRVAKPGMKEYEVVSAIQKMIVDNECDFSYPPIMTINGGILHNHYRGNTLKEGDLLLNDSGVETAMGYAADLTRTFPISARFTAKQRDMYEVVLKAFEESQAIMKPGLNFKEVHRKAAESLAEGFIDLGLMKGNAQEAVANNAHTLFFQCGTGHLMGLDVHDMEDLGEQHIGYTEEDPKDQKTFGWKSLRLGKALEAKNVVTVEPGFYAIPQLIDMWQKENKLAEYINYDKVNEYRDFGGIRIEDDFLITENGYRILGDGLLKTADDIEKYRAEHFS